MKNSIPLFLALLSSLVAAAQTTTVYFDSNRTDLKPATIKTLDSLVLFLNDKDWRMEINGHCDNTGIDRFNQILSDFRAEAVFKYLLPKVKDSNGNFVFKGFSSSLPVADNATEQGKAKNRRVELVVNLTQSPKIITEKKREHSVEAAPKAEPAKTETLDEKINSEELTVGKTLVLKDLNFIGGSAQLLKESESSLQSLLNLLQENATVEIEIHGHVCCANDMKLSVDRALTVRDYLVDNGISEKRLKCKGHSWNKPVASDETETGRIQNRRVEIEILKR